MAGEKKSIPEAWIGQPVKLVFLGGSSTDSTTGDLQEVNDRGVVLAVETRLGHGAHPLFYPWNSIIQLSEAKEP